MGQYSILPMAAVLWLSLRLAPAGGQRPRSVPPGQPAAPAPTETVTLPGIVEPAASIPLKVAAHGWVRQVFFEEGDYVRKRQILLRLYRNGPYSTEFDRHYVLAPQAGFVIRKKVEVGQHVASGGQVAILQDVAQVKVPLLMPYQLAQRIRLCDPVSVSIAELPGRQFTGVVERITGALRAGAQPRHAPAPARHARHRSAPDAAGRRHGPAVSSPYSRPGLFLRRRAAIVHLSLQPCPDFYSCLFSGCCVA
jgi:multidrug efflux pump subunit AcrA (membrane-fusion protein)